VGDVLEAAAQELLARVADDGAEAVVDPQPAAVETDVRHADGGVVERGPEHALAGAELIVRSAVTGDDLRELGRARVETSQGRSDGALACFGSRPVGDFQNAERTCVPIDIPRKRPAVFPEPRLLDSLPLVDLGKGSEPPDHPVFVVPERLGPTQEPSIAFVLAPEAECQLEGLASPEGRRNPVEHFAEVLGMDRSLPALAQGLLGGEPGVFGPLAVQMQYAAVLLCGPDDHPDGSGGNLDAFVTHEAPRGKVPPRTRA
jgi:hypothetical protein